jgi:signal transduction histidine kinase
LSNSVPNLQPTSILIVEDEGIVARDIHWRLESLGYEVTGEAHSAEEALLAVRQRRPDLALMDVSIPGALDGIELATFLQNRHKIPVVYVTAHSDDITLARAKSSAPVGYIRKPFTTADLKIGVEIGLQTHRLRTALEGSNQRWEALSQSLAHDLNENLRAVQCYSLLLADATDEFLEDSEREYLQFVTDGCSRMQNMISSLLQYYRAAAGEQSPAPIDSAEVVNEVLKNLAVAIRDSGAQIHTSRLAKVQVHSMALTQIFQNLISNAIKYRAKGTPLVVHISAEHEGSFARFTVSDNGEGFDSEEAENIFELFKRVHKRERSGSGIGLATCRRLVEQYGGRIWAESSVGTGARFYFTIPLAQKSSMAG